MANKSSPPPMTPEDFSMMLDAQRQWERSGGQEGQKAELAGANLQGLDLSSYNLSHLDFQGANLARVEFGDASVEGTSLRAADLREADLSEARGLLAPQLAGADLAGAKLPADLQEFASVKHVDAASSHVQKIFFVLLLVCAYCWLTIAVTTDAGLLNNFVETPLPIIGTKINLVMFYWAAPFLLLCIYLYFHLCLQRLWEALAELPAVFPDGLPLPHRVHPWLWNGLVWTYFPHLRDRCPPLLFLQKILAILLVWWAGPMTILALWFRYLPAHDWSITVFQLVLLTLALDGALGFSLLTRVTLRLKERKSLIRKKIQRVVLGMVLILSTAAIAGIFSLFSLAAINRLFVFPLMPSIERFHRRPLLSANLIGADVSLKPLQWTGKFADIDLVRGADLRGRNLLLAWAPGAFLVKANLAFANLYNANLMSANLKQAHFEQADLRYANLDFADLQQSTLIMANLEHAYLQGAKLQEANLGWANLKHANLGGANLEGAKFLQKEQVMAASCWQLAKYPQEMLPILHLSPNHNENLDKKNLILCQLPGADLRKANLLGFNLWGANLQGADLEDAIFAWADLREANLFMANLKGADLRDARGLTREKLQSAIMDEHTKLPDELKDLIPSRTKKP